MDRRLEKFILDHSSREDPVLEDLYRQTHIRFINPNMVCGHLQGKFLEMISRMITPSYILEIGTFTGYSAICLARGLRAGGRLTTIEPDDEHLDFISHYFLKAEVNDRISLITGRAQEIVPALEMEFDLVYIDGDKREYCEYYDLVIKKVRNGGFILADNVIWGLKALDKTTNDAQTMGIMKFNEMLKEQKNIDKLILPIRDGIMIIRKKF